MPGQTLVNAMTQLAKQTVLSTLVGDGGAYALDAGFIYLVTDVTIDPLTEAISDITLGEGGLEGNKSVTAWTGPTVSDKGHVFVNSSLLIWNHAADGDPQTVKGLVITALTAHANPLNYVEFDEPVVIAAAGQSVNVMLEIGFNAHEFYVKAHVIPLGE